MSGLLFLNHPPINPSVPTRTDIACFVGFVARRPGTALSPLITQWLDEQGWTAPPYQRPLDTLFNLPIPIDRWDVFDQLFQWEQRPLDSRGQTTITYLGAAVRSFFAQGGRKCYVVRVGDPWPYATPRSNRVPRITDLIPGYPSQFTPSPIDQNSWFGVGHIFGLTDVSFLCLPDLCDVVQNDIPTTPVDIPVPPTSEQFVECSTSISTPPLDGAAKTFQAPRCHDAGYQDWARALHLILEQLIRHTREVQLLAAVPIPQEESEAGEDLPAFLTRHTTGPLASHPDLQPLGVASSFLQLAYPWLRIPSSRNLPEQLESPEGVFSGLLARNALIRGSFHSAARLPLIEVFDLFPKIPKNQLTSFTGLPNDGQKLDAHISLFHQSPAGFSLLTDVTTSQNPDYRPGGVNRLVSVIVRAARELGEGLTFEPSGERVWRRMKIGLETLLGNLLQIGALHGKRPADAFQVRCDRSTMSQQDLDQGRVIAEVSFQAAYPIEQITIFLAMDEGGQVSLLSTDSSSAVSS